MIFFFFIHKICHDKALRIYIPKFKRMHYVFSGQPQMKFTKDDSFSKLGLPPQNTLPDFLVRYTFYDPTQGNRIKIYTFDTYPHPSCMSTDTDKSLRY